MSGISWGEQNDPAGFADLMSKFSEADYRLIASTVLRVGECIAEFDSIEKAVSYCKAMAVMTSEMADKKAALIQKERASLPPAPVPAEGLLDAWRRGDKE